MMHFMPAAATYTKLQKSNQNGELEQDRLGQEKMQLANQSLFKKCSPGDSGVQGGGGRASTSVGFPN